MLPREPLTPSSRVFPRLLSSLKSGCIQHGSSGYPVPTRTPSLHLLLLSPQPNKEKLQNWQGPSGSGMALEEWCNWLEGAKVHFLVWTDHHNLEHIHSAKRLNSRQKPADGCSLTGLTSPCPTGPVPVMRSPMLSPISFWRALMKKTELSNIIQASCFSASVNWEIKERVQVATENQPGPSSCPPDRLFFLASPLI